MTFITELLITLIDPDIGLSLPAKWGTEYQVVNLQAGFYLNGKRAFLLSLTPLRDLSSNLSSFPQGCQQIELAHTDYPYQYLPCLSQPLPPAVGSAFGTNSRIWEVRKVLKNFPLYPPQFHLCWRITLAPRRDPIQFLPPSSF